MGNLASCVLTNRGSPESVKSQIVLPNSEIRYVDGGPHTSAAEVMLEYPGYFLVSSRSLRVGSRFMALTADDELEGGHVYVMYPMRKVNSVVKASDVGPLLQAAHKMVEKRSNGRSGQMRTVSGGAEWTAGMEREKSGGGLTNGEDERLTGLEGESMRVGTRRRSALQTIHEEGVL